MILLALTAAADESTKLWLLDRLPLLDKMRLLDGARITRQGWDCEARLGIGLLDKAGLLDMV